MALHSKSGDQNVAHAHGVAGRPRSLGYSLRVGVFIIEYITIL